MKKTYVKPELYFESFELSSNIASGCAKPTGHAEYVCPYTLATGKKIFASESEGCQILTQDGSGYSLCYHNPTEGSNLFSS